MPIFFICAVFISLHLGYSRELLKNIVRLEYNNYGEIEGEDIEALNSSENLIDEILSKRDKILGSFLQENHYNTKTEFINKLHYLLYTDFRKGVNEFTKLPKFIQRYLENHYYFKNTFHESIETVLLYKALTGITKDTFYRPYDCDIMSFIIYDILDGFINIKLVLGFAHVLLVYQTPFANIYYDVINDTPAGSDNVILQSEEEIYAVIYNNIAVAWFNYSSNNNAVDFARENIQKSFKVLGAMSQYIAQNFKLIEEGK